MIENIKDRDLYDMVDVIIVYGLDKIEPKADKPEEASKMKIDAEKILRAFQKKWPNTNGNLTKEVIEVFNKYELDEEFKKILIKMPAAIELAAEYKSKPGGP